jgi:DNA mismatch repair protein MutS
MKNETSPTLTPLMATYQRIKKELPPNTLLAIRLGDFYEFFFDDARLAAKALKITLTHRRDVPMCGFPYHAKDSYAKTILKAGYQLALTDAKDFSK